MLDKKICDKVLDAALETGADFAEIFLEKSYASSISMSENQIKNAGSAEDYGIGVRIFKGDFQSYAYTNIIDETNLIKTAKKVASSLREKRIITPAELKELNYPTYVKPLMLGDKIAKSDKVNMMLKSSMLAYSNPLVSKVEVDIIEYNQDVLIANSEGVFAIDKRARTRFMENVFVSRDDKIDKASDNIGASQGWELFDGFDLESFNAALVDEAASKLDAVNCPCGIMPVIVHNSFGGVIFHEACGHGLEALSIAKKSSVFTDKMGKIIASPIVTAIDDGTIKSAWGSLNIDDEAVPTQKNILIKNGVLNSYLVDKFNGRKIGLESTGSGRRQSYKFIPTARMNNTYIEAGKSSFNDIISNTEYGLFASKLSGGSVNTATGDFNFSVSQGFMVEKGKITKQVKGAKLIGKGHEVLKKIDMVGNNLDLGCGVCGASSGRVPTTVGQPTIRVSDMVVGGQE